MTINLHIERLVLEGLPITGSQGPIVAIAVEKELRRLLAAGGIATELRSGGAMPYASGDAMQFSREVGPRQLGTQIAKSVHGGLERVNE